MTAMAMARPWTGPAAAGDADLSAALGRNGWPVVFAVWAAFAVFQVVSGFPDAVARMSTDDAMRLAQVRDLIAGQKWFDLTQARLNPPDGVVMHWSRLVDLPIALILAVSERLFDADAALKVTATAWPLLVFLAALLAGAAAASAVAGPAAGALSAIMFVASPAVTLHFGPGALDHHNVQIALALTMLAGAMRLDRSDAAAIVAGLAAAAMMAVGMETAPHVAACAGFVALRWASEGAAVARGARRFGLAFACGTVVAALATVAPDRWSAPVCDALGVGHIFAAVIGGVGLGAATALTTGGRLARLSSLGQVAFATLAGVAIMAPECIASPYGALPERLKVEWLAHVDEAHGFVASAAADPVSGLTIGFALLGLTAAALFAFFAAAPETRWRAGTALAMLAAGLAVTAWQIRGASLAFAAGGVLLPAAALAIGRTGDRLRLTLAVAGLAPMTIAAAGLGAAHAMGLSSGAEGEARKSLCPASEYAAFAQLSPGLALNTTDTGPFIIAFTPHAAVSAPYHRNVDGLLAALDAFDGGEEAARAVAISRGARYVVACATDGGVTPAAEARPDGFSARLLSGPAPSWLTPVDLGSSAKLKVWRVVPAR